MAERDAMTPTKVDGSKPKPIYISPEAEKLHPSDGLYLKTPQMLSFSHLRQCLRTVAWPFLFAFDSCVCVSFY